MLEIKTKRLLLREFEEKDVQALFEILSDEEVNKFLPMFPLKDLVSATKYLKEHYLDKYANHDGYHFAICLKDDNIPIGYIHLSGDESHDFGYGLKKEFWHMGIVSEAAMAFVNKLKEIGISYITATHDTHNPNSGAVMKKIGMAYKYSYVEQWQPKGILVTFRMYQLNFDDKKRVYKKYWNDYSNHFIETEI